MTVPTQFNLSQPFW
uniref:Uncharacterized protein n=1 Tax=Anguilla anguilla TaxID=7936 RepID=A0A0E9UW93_ANGAN